MVENTQMTSVDSRIEISDKRNDFTISPLAERVSTSPTVLSRDFFEQITDLLADGEIVELGLDSKGNPTNTAERFKIGDPQEMMLVALWRSQRRQSAMQQLLARYKGLIDKEVARSLSYLRGRMHFADDLRSEAKIAFIRAVDAFDPSRGLVSVAPLARVFLRHSLAAFVYEFDKAFRQSRNSREARAMRAWARLKDVSFNDGDYDIVERIVSETGERHALVSDVVGAATSRMTTIGVAPGESDPEDDYQDPCSNLMRADVARQAIAFAGRLCERDREIFFNEMKDDPDSLCALATRWKITPARAVQIRKATMAQAREYFSSVGYESGAF